jgi:hypothetical protein
MGAGAPGAEDCEAAAGWDCYMAPLPSGTARQPTRLLGEGWDRGCANAPELWGAERSLRVLNLEDASHVEVACLEITDHSGCVEFHTGGLACPRDNVPFGPWAAIGLYAEDSTDVVLTDLDIHGLAAGGVHAGRLADWTVRRVRIAGNGRVGWDGDVEGEDSNAGTIRFSHVTVEWNGCGETYPAEGPTGCWGQSAGGYGDGLGTGATGGRWIFEDCAFRHNASDGLDLLYAREPGSAIEIRRTIAEGNAGNPIKTSGSATIENSVVVGNCGYFAGKPFTFDVDHCRARGNALSLAVRLGSIVSLTNNTVTGEGDCLVLAVCEGCSSERVLMRNNLFQGQVDLVQAPELTCFAYAEGFGADPFDTDYSFVFGTKDGPICVGGHDVCGDRPGVADPSIDSFDGRLLAGSPAIDAGTTEGAPTVDVEGRPRDGRPDIGAYEWR